MKEKGVEKQEIHLVELGIVAQTGQKCHVDLRNGLVGQSNHKNITSRFLKPMNPNYSGYITVEVNGRFTFRLFIYRNIPLFVP